MWSENHNDFIPLTELEFNSETSNDGYSLINNSIIVNIIDETDISYDVHFGNVHGLEIQKLNSLVKKIEQVVGYVVKLPEYGDLLGREEFIQDVEAGCFTDYDGYGHPVKNDLMDDTITVWPSKISLLPEDCTHIIWFNK